MFTAAADVLRRIGEDGRVIQEFVELGAKAKVAASEARDAEATLGEIPDEFLDPIQVRFSFSPFLHLGQLFFISTLWATENYRASISSLKNS